MEIDGSTAPTVGASKKKQIEKLTTYPGMIRATRLMRYDFADTLR